MVKSRNCDFVVESVCASIEKGTAKHPVKFIEVDEQGVLGDAHRGTAGRNVSLLDRDLMDTLAIESGVSIGNGQMGENITYRMIGSDHFGLGDRIRIGEVVLQIAQIGKECHGDRCAIFKAIGRCVMPDSGLFTKVLTGGVVKPGMKGELMDMVLLG